MTVKPLSNDALKDDQGLLAPSASSEAYIKVCGIGGAGNNTVNRLMTIGIRGAECVAINTDKQHLDNVKAHKKILIGETIASGLGAGGYPEVGAAAAEESKDKLINALMDSKLVFLAAGLGGGTGTGSAPVIAEIAKSIGAIVIGVVTLPFKIENARIQKAQEGLNILRRFADTVVIIDNNRLLEIALQYPIDEAFSVADEVLANFIKGITETIALPSLINLDFADVRTIMHTSGGVAIVGLGESNSLNRAEDAVLNALECPLLDVNVEGATRAIIHITGGADLSLSEANKTVEILASKLDPNAQIIMGARVEPRLEDILRVILIVTGVQSPQILGPERRSFSQNKTNYSRIYKMKDFYSSTSDLDLGLDRIDDY